MREMLKVGADLRLLASAVTSDVTWTECLGRTPYSLVRTMGRTPYSQQSTILHSPKRVRVRARPRPGSSGQGEACQGQARGETSTSGEWRAPVVPLQPTPHQTLDSWQRDFATTRINNLLRHFLNRHLILGCFSMKIFINSKDR